MEGECISSYPQNIEKNIFLNLCIRVARKLNMLKKNKTINQFHVRYMSMSFSKQENIFREQV